MFDLYYKLSLLFVNESFKIAIAKSVATYVIAAQIFAVLLPVERTPCQLPIRRYLGDQGLRIVFYPLHRRTSGLPQRLALHNRKHIYSERQYMTGVNKIQ
jgi:hypothetical protein